MYFSFPEQDREDYSNMSQVDSSISSNIMVTNLSPEEENFRCHEYYKSHMKLVLDLKFWLETVVLSIIAMFGFFGNIMTFIVLRKQVRFFNSILFKFLTFDFVL